MVSRLSEFNSYIRTSIEKCHEAGYAPTRFQNMVAEMGSYKAAKVLAESTDTETGFAKMIELGLRDWTAEAAVVKFADLFPQLTVICAKWKLRATQ